MLYALSRLSGPIMMKSLKELIYQIISNYVEANQSFLFFIVVFLNMLFLYNYVNVQIFNFLQYLQISKLIVFLSYCIVWRNHPCSALPLVTRRCLYSISPCNEQLRTHRPDHRKGRFQNLSRFCWSQKSNYSCGKWISIYFLNVTS